MLVSLNDTSRASTTDDTGMASPLNTEQYITLFV